jgi:hypothetical protein
MAPPLLISFPATKHKITIVNRYVFCKISYIRSNSVYKLTGLTCFFYEGSQRRVLSNCGERGFYGRRQVSSSNLPR